MKINLNGQAITIQKDFLSYDDIVLLVGGPPNVVHSIMWSCPLKGAQSVGSVVPDGKVLLAEGICITAMVTDNA